MAPPHHAHRAEVVVRKPYEPLARPCADGTIHRMRVNLITKVSRPPATRFGAIPVSLTVRPACGLPGDYVYETTSTALLRMLNSKTDLPSSVLRRFEGEMATSPTARLLGVELSDRVLTEIGYFVD